MQTYADKIKKKRSKSFAAQAITKQKQTRFFRYEGDLSGVQENKSEVLQAVFLRNFNNPVHWKDMEDGSDYTQIAQLGNQLTLQNNEDGSIVVVLVTNPQMGMAQTEEEIQYLNLGGDQELDEEFNDEEPHWSEQMANYAGSDALKLARLLRTKFEGNDNETYDETSFNGVEKALLEKPVVEYDSIDAFLAAAEQKTDWGEKHGGALEDYLKRKDGISQLGDISLANTDYRVLREAAKNVPEVGVDGYDRPISIQDEGLWTDGMGPCITLAMTAESDGKRFNALLHSFNLDASGDEIVDAMKAMFDSNEAVPNFADLKNKKLYVAGGNSDTEDKAEKLLWELIKRELPVEGYDIASGDEDAGLTKALLITKEGQILYSKYDPKDEKYSDLMKY